MLVFDEVDAGVGGRTARAVGEKLAALAETAQVICITHLAQVAALADHHFRVVKEPGDPNKRYWEPDLKPIVRNSKFLALQTAYGAEP